MLDTIHFSFLQPFSHIPLAGNYAISLVEFTFPFLTLGIWVSNIIIITVVMFLCLSFRLQEAILSIPRGITRLMDMLMDREV